MLFRSIELLGQPDLVRRDNQGILANLGYAELNANQLELAKTHLARAVELDNTDMGTKVNLGLLFTKLKDDAKAREIFQEVQSSTTDKVFLDQIPQAYRAATNLNKSGKQHE